MKKIYETPEVDVVEISVEYGFAASSTIEDPVEEAENPDYWA